MDWPPLSLLATSSAAPAIACGSDMAATADPAARMNARLVSFMELSSRLDRYPDFETAGSGREIERLADAPGFERFGEAFEARCIGGLVSRVRKPLGPDRADRTADRRNVLAMGEYSVFLLAQSQAAEGGRKPGEIGHFRAGDVIEIALVIAVA